MGAKWVRKLTAKSSKRDPGRASRKLRCTRALWVEPCDEKEKAGVPYDVQPFVLSKWQDGKTTKKDCSVYGTPSSRGRVWLKFKADKYDYFLHSVIAFVYGNPTTMPWSRFKGVRNYQTDHTVHREICLRKSLQVVTRLENLRRDRERRAKRIGIYAKTKVKAKAKPKAKAKAKARRD